MPIDIDFSGLELDIDFGKISTKAKDLTKTFEGFRSNIYLDSVGKRTIGYGFNLDDPAISKLLSQEVVEGAKPLTPEEAEPVFDYLYRNAEQDAIRYIGGKDYNKLPANIQDTLIDMAYNMGYSRLSGFKKMKAALIDGDYEKAREEMKDSKWFNQTGQRAQFHYQNFLSQTEDYPDFDIDFGEEKSKNKNISDHGKQVVKSALPFSSIAPILTSLRDSLRTLVTYEPTEEMERISKERVSKLPWVKPLQEFEEMVPEGFGMELGMEGLKQFARPVAAIQAGIGAEIEKKPIIPETIKGFLEPEKVKSITERVPLTEWETQGSVARIIPRSIAEGIENYALYSLVYGVVPKAVKTAETNLAMSRLEKSLPIWEKAGVKFPQGISKADKVNIILGAAKNNPEVGEIVKRVVITPSFLWRKAQAISPKFNVGDLVKVGEQVAEILDIAGTKAILGMGGQQFVANLEDLQVEAEKQSLSDAPLFEEEKDLLGDWNIGAIVKGQDPLSLKSPGEITKFRERVEKEAFRQGRMFGRDEIEEKVDIKRIVDRYKKEARLETNKMLSDIKNIDTSKMSPQEAQPIREIQEQLDYAVPTKKTLSSLQKTREFIETHPDAEMPDYVLEKVKRLEKLNRSNLSIEDLRDMHRQVLHYAHLNKLRNKLKVGQEIRRVEEVLSSSIQEMKPLPKLKNDIVESQPQKFKKIKDIGKLIVDTFGIRHDHYDLIVESLAGINSTMDKVLFQEVKNGKIEEMRYRQQVYKNREEFVKGFMQKYKIRDITEWKNERIPIDKFNLTRGERMALYRHTLNKNNLYHILGRKGGIGFKHSDQPFQVHKITEQELNSVLNSLTPDEKEYAGQSITDFFDEQGQTLQKTFYQKNGYELPLENYYYPIEVMKTTLGKELEAESILEELKNKWVRIGLKKGMLEHRKGSDLPIYLNDIDYDVNKSVMNAAAYVGLEIPLSNASKLLYNKNFRNAIYTRYGQQTWAEIEKGLRDIAGDWQSYSTVEGILMKLKNNLSSAILGLNPFVMAKQILSFPLYNVYVKTSYLTQGFIDYISHPKNVIQRHKTYSPEYLERIEGGYSRDVADVFKTNAIKRLYGGKTSIKEKAMGGIKLFDENAVNPGMQGAVLQVLDEFKTNQFSPEVITALDLEGIDISKLTSEDKMKLAYRFADWVTERTQPMFSPEHRASLSRGTPIEKLGTQFSSFTNQALNLIRRTWRESQRTKDPKAYAKLLKVLFYLLVVNTGGVYAIDSIRDRMFKRDRKKGFGEAILDSIASYFFFIRDIEGSVVSKVKKGTFRGYDISIPVLSFANSLGDTISDGFGALIEDDSNKRKKRGLKFVDGTFDALFTLEGIPYRTPKKLITKPFVKDKDFVSNDLNFDLDFDIGDIDFGDLEI